jgi:hypothetical protein
VTAALVAHTVGHGQVDPAGAAWAFAALVAPAWWLAGRRRGWIAVALTQLVGQQVAHLAMSASASAAGEHAHLLVGSDLMLYAHLAAAALTGTWLWLGERRAWAAVRRLLLVFETPPEPAVAPPGPLNFPPVGHHPGLGRLRHSLARRGPPLPA